MLSPLGLSWSFYCDHQYEYYDDDNNDQKYMICYSSDIKSVTNNISYVHVIYM